MQGVVKLRWRSWCLMRSARGEICAFGIQ
ncbi:hypothetical protein QQP08_000774 [Theobroma cacao]|nr:hypothetical protein QQP08_000774 [Theobroma cacao]